MDENGDVIEETKVEYIYDEVWKDKLTLFNGQSITYDAWGQCTVDYDSTGYIAAINPFRYRGYYLDRETGFYYLNSRYYDASTGRFINADSPEYVSIQGGNLFTYCGNCPTKNADYFGFCYVPTYPETYIPPAPSYSYGKEKKEDGLLESVLKGIGIVFLIVGALVMALIRDIVTLINENKWLKSTLEVLETILVILACFYSASWIIITGSIIGGILLIASIFDKDNTIFDWLGIGFGISNYIKEKKWKDVLSTVFSNFDEILDFLKKLIS